MVCKHLNFYVEYEQILWGAIIMDSSLPLSHEELASMRVERTGRIRVICSDCDLDRKYTRSTTPDWVKRALDG